MAPRLHEFVLYIDNENCRNVAWGFMYVHPDKVEFFIALGAKNERTLPFLSILLNRLLTPRRCWIKYRMEVAYGFLMMRLQPMKKIG